MDFQTPSRYSSRDVRYLPSVIVPQLLPLPTPVSQHLGFWSNQCSHSHHFNTQETQSEQKKPSLYKSVLLELGNYSPAVINKKILIITPKLSSAVAVTIYKAILSSPCPIYSLSADPQKIPKARKSELLFSRHYLIRCSIFKG